MWRAKGFTLNAIKSSSASGKRKLLVNPLHDVLCRGHNPKVFGSASIRIGQEFYG